ncbi:unnamed protein product [Sphenostylis stenocarpa]|uniref:Uncharacterized protein n=1 Tax=Sphenostylis stenocarpa TaxID=92480 RepID=A0AA86S0W5_9FABA|nr:unnamed protein product [Sphenostylis stenocarpa]
MIRRSPSRNYRSRGVTVKQALQIILFLGVCFWLIYQVKHSHDKKKEFVENDAKVSVGTQTLKLGRKDLHLGKDEVVQNERREKEENNVEDEDKHEHDEHEEEGNEHESEEQEGEDEQEEDERGGENDEIDENVLDQSEADTDHDEELVDNEKDQEEDDPVENDGSHEAREEQYKGDDASSAVTHDTGTTSTETESNLINSDAKSEMKNRKLGNRPKSHRNQNSSNLEFRDAELAGGTSYDASLLNAVNSSHLDNVTLTSLDNHSEAGTNLEIVIPGGSNNSTGISINTSFELNETVILSESNQSQNGTMNTTVSGDVKNVPPEGLVQGGNRVSEENHPSSNSTVPVEIEKGDAAAGESSDLEGGELEKTTKSMTSNEIQNSNTEMSETKNTQNIFYVKENTDATKIGFKVDTQTDETSYSSSSIGTSDPVEHHDTDPSDFHILKSVTEVQTDLDTLADIRNEGKIGGATATD